MNENAETTRESDGEEKKFNYRPTLKINLADAMRYYRHCHFTAKEQRERGTQATQRQKRGKKFMEIASVKEERVFKLLE